VSNLDITQKFKDSKFKNIFWFAVASLIFAALLLAAEPSKIISSITQAEPVYILAAFITGFMVINCWALNWFVFFKSLNIDCSYFRTFHVFTAGQFFNNITPLGRFGGQPIMAYLISKNSGSTYEKALATVMSADLVTVIPMTLYITTGLTYLTTTATPSQKVTTASLTLLGFLTLGILIGFTAWFKPGTIEKYSLKITNKTTQKLGKGEKIHQKINEKAENWEKTLQTIGKHPKTLIQSLIITGSAFLFRMTTFYLILASLGLQIHPLKIMLIIPLISFASISPTPGGAGTYEAAMAATIILLTNLNFATALTTTILYRITTYWQTITIGYISTTTLGKIPSKKQIPQT